MTFQLIAGQPALDLVNTLDWRFGAREREDLLKTYEDLLRFVEQSKLLTPAQTRRLRRASTNDSRSQTLADSVELREALAAIFYARLDGRQAPAADRTKLQRFFQTARLHQELDWSKSPRLEWDWPADHSTELPVWALALSAADLMTSDAVDRVRACNNLECRWLFLDTSRNHSRRWCEMKLCGNRMKARRFKSRYKQ